MNVRLRRRGPLFVWAGSLVAGVLIASALLVFARTEITNLRYRLTRLVERENVLEARVEKLRIEAAALSAAERLEPRARALGLRYPAPGQVIALEDLQGEAVDVAAAPQPESR